MLTQNLVIGQLVIPGANNTDGPLNASGTDHVINLALAQTGLWTDSPDTPGFGIYDPDKWAVVFKYSAVNIPAGTKVTFLNHPSGAPVVWLVDGVVSIEGELNLSGQNQTADTVSLSEGGPGGFRGGAVAQSQLARGGGFGPGGGSGHGAYSGYYGNAQIVPLIGGSGSAGIAQNGGGGGGAILLAATGSLNVTGSILANGGLGPGGHGSGGAVRIVADQIQGAGRIEATSNWGGPGRIRLEGNTVSRTLSLNPPTIGVPPSPVIIWPPAEAPTVRVVSIAGLAVPAEPKAQLDNNGADLIVTSTGPLTITLETRSFPTSGTLNVFIKPLHGVQVIHEAAAIEGDAALATWQVTAEAPLGHFIVQARAVTP